MKTRWHFIWPYAVMVGLTLLGCKPDSSPKPSAASGTSSIGEAAVNVVSTKATASSAPSIPVTKESSPDTWIPLIQGPVLRGGTRFGLAACFTETKHCIQYPLGWRMAATPEAMAGDKIAWGYANSRRVCIAVDRGGSHWEELIRRDEAEQKGFSDSVPVKAGVDAIPANLRVKRLDMATTRPYPFNVLMWFACFGADPSLVGGPSSMPSGLATLIVAKIEIKQGLTFNTYAFVSDSATEEERRDLFATFRGIRAQPGKLATHNR